MPPRRKAAAATAQRRRQPAQSLTDREVEILKAAAGIFQDKGLRATSMEGVAHLADSAPKPPRRKAAAATTRRRRPTDESPDREAEILKASAEVFREKGFAATTTQDIAERVGMLKGSLYYYIDSKEDLLYRIARNVYAELKREQDLAVAADASPLERLRAFIRTHVLHTTSHLAESAAFYGDFRSFTGERRTEIIGWRDDYEAAFRGIIRAGQVDGSIGRNVDVKLVSLGVIGMMNSVHVWYQPGGRRSPRQIADALAEMVIHGLASSAG